MERKSTSSAEQVEDGSWSFKKRDLTRSSLKDIKPDSSLYKEVVSYFLYKMRRTTLDHSSKEMEKTTDFIKHTET